MRVIIFPDVIWDLVADEDDNMQALKEVWDNKGMLSVVLLSFRK